jgi:hypothetical protein
MLSKAASLSALSTRGYLSWRLLTITKAPTRLNAEGIFQDVIARKWFTSIKGAEGRAVLISCHAFVYSKGTRDLNSRDDLVVVGALRSSLPPEAAGWNLASSSGVNQ